jgi:1-acyl-sn-glycerol-3-phosphate acyltransferase
MSTRSADARRRVAAVAKIAGRLSPPPILRQFPFAAPTTPLSVDAPPAAKKTGADYDTEWARRFPARWTRTVLLEAVIRPAMAAIAQPDRQGIDRLADLVEAGHPVIFCANHHSHVDTPLLLSSLPEPWRYKVFVGAAADYFFTTRVTGAVSALALNAIPIERSTVTRKSANQAATLINDGWSMVIFPEGGRSPDGWGQEFRGGAAYLARRCGVAVVPVHLAGTGRILRKGAKALTPGKATVTFGAPLFAADGEDTRRLATRIESAVATLADEHQTGWYDARRRAHAGQTPSLSGAHSTGWRRAWASPDGRRSKATGRKTWPEL